MLPFCVIWPSPASNGSTPQFPRLRFLRCSRFQFFLFNMLQIALPATLVFSQPSALPGVSLSTRFLRNFRTAPGYELIFQWLARSLSPTFEFGPLFSAACALFSQIPGVYPCVCPSLRSVVVAALGATRSKMAPSTLDSHRGVTR